MMTTDDIAFLVLATIDILDEPTAFMIYQTHAEQDDLFEITLDLPTVQHALWQLQDIGLIDVHRTISSESIKDGFVTVPYYAISGLGKLALKHRGMPREWS